MNGPAESPVVPRLVPRLLPRLLNVRQRMRAGAVDAFVVSHLPNIRYLTGFVGTAGLVVLTPTACALIVDFRYQTVARALLSANPEAAAHFNVVVPAQSYDETLADVLREARHVAADEKIDGTGYRVVFNTGAGAGLGGHLLLQAEVVGGVLR